MIDVALLGLLKERPRHGYELKKQLGELLGARPAVSYGSLYPALAKLEEAGDVRAVDPADDDTAPAPMTGSIAGELAAFRARRRPRRDGRGRKVYGITERGERRLVELLSGDASDERAFALALAFCRFIPPDRRVAMFSRRRGTLAARLADVQRALAAARAPQQPDRYRVALLAHQVDTITADIAWLDGLIEAERRGEVPDPIGGHR